jgi:hypothetical protein
MHLNVYKEDVFDKNQKQNLMTSTNLNQDHPSLIRREDACCPCKEL